jgi:putative copper resistance protein D
MDLAAALIACRFLHFAAGMLLFGASLFCGGLAPPEFAATLRRKLRGPELVLALLLIVTGIGWLGLETGEIGNGWADTVNPAMIGAVLAGTIFGAVWQVRLVLIVLPLLVLPLNGRRRDLALAVASGLVLASLGFVGHAADQNGALGLLHRLNHALHLLSAGFWVGCLPPLLVTLLLLGRSGLRREIGLTLKRFSGVGHIAVALVLLTGVVNTWLILGGPPTDFAAPYQLLLALKIALVLLMISIALLNRYIAVPRLARTRRALPGLVIGTCAEMAIGAVVVALVSVFATFDPMGMDGGS